VKPGRARHREVGPGRECVGTGPQPSLTTRLLSRRSSARHLESPGASRPGGIASDLLICGILLWNRVRGLGFAGDRVHELQLGAGIDEADSGSIWFNAEFAQLGCQSFGALAFGLGALAFGLGALAFGLGALAFGLGALAFGLGLLH